MICLETGIYIYIYIYKDVLCHLVLLYVMTFFKVVQDVLDQMALDVNCLLGDHGMPILFILLGFL